VHIGTKLEFFTSLVAQDNAIFCANGEANKPGRQLNNISVIDTYGGVLQVQNDTHTLGKVTSRDAGQCIPDDLTVALVLLP
jgi:hypothetical protein